MSAKKALIVDDSKLAQFVLKKMLVEHDLNVDTIESAEEALEYLTQDKPDVIFLDHTLTGMNGLEALKAIKGNPDTATIPVMMYTSQDDGMYMSQARALGALDILPKQLKPVELAKVLEKLRLTEDHNQPEHSSTQSLFTPETTVHVNNEPLVIEENITSETEELSALVRNAEAALEKESLKQFLKLSLEKQQKDLNHSLSDIDQRLAEMAELVKGDRRRRSSNNSFLPFLYLTGMAAVGILLFFIFDELRQQPNNVIGENNAATQTIVEQIKSPDAPLTAQGANELRSALEATLNSNNQVPYDELLMSERVSQELLNIIDAIRATEFAGTLVITGHTGDFCLASDAQGSLSIADPKSAFVDCQVTEPLATIEQISTPELRRFVSDINNDENYSFSLRLEVSGNMQPIATYPEVAPGLKAGAWNQAAQANNRVDFEFID